MRLSDSFPIRSWRCCSPCRCRRRRVARRRRNVVVEIASESAIIVWDSATRRSTSSAGRRSRPPQTGDAKVQDFGFLVPTHQPVLEEVADEAFDSWRGDGPETETRKDRAARLRDRLRWGEVARRRGEGRGSPGEARRGYDAKVLKATDTQALEAGSSSTNMSLARRSCDGLSPTSRKGWIITASDRPRQGHLDGPLHRSTAVRMSFTTDAPFFRQASPTTEGRKGQAPPGVFFLGGQEMISVRGDADWNAKIAWPAAPGENAKALAPC